MGVIPETLTSQIHQYKLCHAETCTAKPIDGHAMDFSHFEAEVDSDRQGGRDWDVW